jgi:hypothetical protein
MSDLKDVLEGGLRSEFWQWFTSKVLEEWGAQGKRYLVELDAALNLSDNDAAASQARQIRSGQKAILALLRIPDEALRKLGDGAEDVPERRRPMDPELVGQSRRGAGL